MKTVDVYLHNPDPSKPPHVIKNGADLLFDMPCGDGWAAAGVEFTTYARGWLRLASRHHTYLPDMEPDGEDPNILIVHLRPVIEPAAPVAGSIASHTNVTPPGIAWFPADVGEA